MSEPQSLRTTFVLVHGATAGGWQWAAVAQLLRDSGHAVYTPTLAGLGERAHLLSRSVDLDTHIEDVAGLLRVEDLCGVVLVGKSYAGMVVTGVAERVPERLRRLVYLDAMVPEDGQSMLDVLGPVAAEHLRALVQSQGDGWLLPLPPGAPERLTPHPFACLTQPLPLRNPAARLLPRTYIRCTLGPSEGPHGLATARMLQRGRAQGWDTYEINADHDAEQHAPALVAGLLANKA
ncbi:MAG TPA: alpha/beta fold hydrolase [Roseiflexaceae bacterium]|nr:alpha/beta fold hydrolase [Roseiflexaceae bacterium]